MLAKRAVDAVVDYAQEVPFICEARTGTFVLHVQQVGTRTKQLEFTQHAPSVNPGTTRPSEQPVRLAQEHVSVTTHAALAKRVKALALTVQAARMRPLSVPRLANVSGTSHCSDCPAGSTASTGQASCTRCDPGKYNTAAGSVDCASCPLGHYAVDSGTTQ
eukprot:3857461-Amphidinium_carterae.1